MLLHAMEMPIAMDHLNRLHHLPFAAILSTENPINEALHALIGTKIQIERC